MTTPSEKTGTLPGNPTLSAAQAAARLGIKQETLYAYVSRGSIARERHSGGSRFDPLEVERFARSRRSVSRAAEPTTTGGVPLTVIDTDIAQIEDGELYFRGRPAAALARDHRYESVVRWLLAGTDDLPANDDVAFIAHPTALQRARDVVAVMPASATLRDLLQVVVTTLGTLDPLRFDLRTDTVSRSAAALIGGMVDALPPRGVRAEPDAALAARLWPALTSQSPTIASLNSLNAALVLLIDHDIAVSTLAARAAASARANIYAVVSSGLGALDSALHGNASHAAHLMLEQVRDTGAAERVIGDWIQRTGRGVPGFGHGLYPGRDPRATALLELLETVPGGRSALDAARTTIALVVGRTGAEPNVDFALATLSVASGMRADAGEAIFAVARTGGWIAHALDEYRMPALRLRPIGRYIGP